MSGEFQVTPDALRVAASVVRAVSGDLDGLRPGVDLHAAGSSCPGGATAAAAGEAADLWQASLAALVAKLDASANALVASSDTYDRTDAARAAVFTTVLE